MIGQLFVMSQRGDTLLMRDYRGDIVRGTPEIFFRRLKQWKGEDPPPLFDMDGIQFMFIKTHGLYFVCTTKFNVSPFLVVEMLNRLATLIKDYCGVVSEESLRLNFGLVYELLDEVMDFGYPQATSSDVLKSHIYDKPAPVMDGSGNFIKKLEHIGKVTQPSTATNKPITKNENRTNKNEIFVDLLERLTVLFGAGGEVLRYEVDGTIQMKSYLSGNPTIKMGLNQDVQIGRSRENPGLGVTVLDDCNFHESVSIPEFEEQRVISFTPPDGEFVLMNYRSSGEFTTPFRVFPFLEECGVNRLDLNVRIRADISQNLFATNVIVRIPLPKLVTSCSSELSNNETGQQTFEFKQQEKQAIWKIKKFMGGTEQTLRIKVMVNNNITNATKKEMGPISLDFELANLTVTGISINFLRVFERSKTYTPLRWVRCITYSNSYVCRI